MRETSTARPSRDRPAPAQPPRASLSDGGSGRELLATTRGNAMQTTWSVLRATGALLEPESRTDAGRAARGRVPTGTSECTRRPLRRGNQQKLKLPKKFETQNIQ
ncbi:hypothetical protein EVAR_40502_1 [Eumeta japonica]|uniref:Uncharacterized protein n=1 Tax=Eumeta variegata TaxID=151549 RepID=A0A4C1XV14_EUMVA|nr:hypothetical protein EVAR_40502_1 [Eumeta japonica]